MSRTTVRAGIVDGREAGDKWHAPAARHYEPWRRHRLRKWSEAT
jgi:hypothetical protein